MRLPLKCLFVGNYREYFSAERHTDFAERTDLPIPDRDALGSALCDVSVAFFFDVDTLSLLPWDAFAAGAYPQLHALCFLGACSLSQPLLDALGAQGKAAFAAPTWDSALASAAVRYARQPSPDVPFLANRDALTLTFCSASPT